MFRYSVSKQLYLQKELSKSMSKLFCLKSFLLDHFTSPMSTNKVASKSQNSFIALSNSYYLITEIGTKNISFIIVLYRIKLGTCRPSIACC